MTHDDESVDDGDDAARAAALVEAGYEIAGGVAGAGVGLIFGPPGALAGAVAGPLITRGLKRVLGDFAGRRLSRRETVRAGAAAAFAPSKSGGS